MGSKKKGTKAERELVHLFWKASWAATRVAGSGSMSFPSPDIVAGNGKRTLAIECKSLKDPYKYFSPEEINELLDFSQRFGAEPWIGVRFDRTEWYFFNLQSIEKNKNGTYVISLAHTKSKGLKFHELLQQKRGDSLYEQTS